MKKVSGPMMRTDLVLRVLDFMPYLGLSKDGSPLIRLHVQPKSRKTRIVGLHDGCLKLAVASPPVDGKANKAILKYLATVLGLSARHVVLRSGLQSRKKVVCVESMTGEQVRRVLEELVKT